MLLLSKSSCPSEFQTPSMEVIWTDYSACRKVSVFSTPNLLFFFQAYSEEYHSCLLEYNSTAVWTSVYLLFVGAAMALSPPPQFTQDGLLFWSKTS